MNNKVFSNAMWIIGCKVVQSLISFIIGIFTARFLGPSNYGLITYAVSIVAFFHPLVKLGFDSILVREIIYNPEKEGEILGTSLIFSLISSFVSILGIFFFVFFVNAGEYITIIVCILYSFILVFQACENILYWFQAKLLSKYSSIFSLIAYICVALYKIFILYNNKSIYWFVLVHVIEVALISFMLMIFYLKKSKKSLTFSLSLGKELLQKSKYYILTGLMVTLFQQTDKIMLKLMIDESETGFYSIALTCVGTTAFIYGAIIDSLRPSILEGYKISKAVFEHRIRILFSIITYLSIFQCLFMSVFANQIISIIYGPAYYASVNILKISVWYITFGYYGMVIHIWILANEKQKFLLPINILGAIINIVMNFSFIPIFGACGAALASVITQFIINFLTCFIIKPMRPIAKLMITSFNPKYVMSYFIKLISRK